MVNAVPLLPRAGRSISTVDESSSTSRMVTESCNASMVDLGGSVRNRMRLGLPPAGRATFNLTHSAYVL